MKKTGIDEPAEYAEPVVPDPGLTVDDAMAVASGKRTYEVVTNEGRLRFTCPESYKITYGPISPGGKGYGGSGVMALRVYESDTKQRAIFTNVVSFRDLSMPISRLAVKRKGSRRWEVDDGRRSSSAHEIEERRWVADDLVDSGVEAVEADEGMTLSPKRFRSSGGMTSKVEPEDMETTF